MATQDRISIPASRYGWAIQRAGLTVDGYINSHPKTALPQWMDGTKQPTIKQLEDFAKRVNVPFGFLLLETVPTEAVPFPVFRGEAGQHNGFDLNVYDTVNAVKRRQEWLEDYLRDNELDTCRLVGAVNLQTPIDNAVNSLRKELGLEPKWAFEQPSTEVAVKIVTECLEGAGVFVAFNGVVGNNTHRPLDVSECRGFALVNEVAPYIFVNSADAPVAQLFTLIHEAAHLMLGVSAGHAATDTLSNDALERYCDRVAAEFLVPHQVLTGIWEGDIKRIARKFKVSELVIARRAHDIGLLSNEAYRRFWHEYTQRPKTEKKQGGGGSFYRTSLKRVGRLFAIHVRNAVDSRQLSYTEAYRLTGLYGKTYDNFMNNNV